jgi:predicted RND superfamily exporter protein
MSEPSAAPLRQLPPVENEAAPSREESPARRYLGRLMANGRVIAVGTLLLLAVAVALVRGLTLHADLAELLPEDDPALVRLHQIGARIGSPATIIVAVEGPRPEENRRFADAVGVALQPLVGHGLRAVDVRDDAARAFFERHRALYAPLDELRRVEEDLDQLLLQGKNPAYVPLDDPAADLRRLAERARQATARSPYLEGEDGHLVAVVGWADSSGSGDESDEGLIARVQRAIDALGPARAGVTARLTGDVVVARSEHDALKQDVALVSVVCTLFILGVIIAFFRSALALPVVFIPTLVALAITTGATAAIIGYVNTNTAFLGSIIVGNGINFAIILLARFCEERQQPGDLVDAAARAVAATWRPTLVAGLGGAIAYGSLAFTHFRGFRQFGFIGGVGMALSWIATYTLGPLLVVAAARRWPTPRRPSRVLVKGIVVVLARPGAAVAVTLIASIAAVLALKAIAHDPFEYDFRRLRNQRSAESGAGRLYSRVGKLFPSDNVAPIAVALVERAEDAVAFREALLARDRRDGGAGGPLLADVAIAQRLLPTDQPEKLALLERLRRRLDDPTLAARDPDDRRELESFRPPAQLRPLVLADLPESLARPFRERDGTLGRVALEFPVQKFQGWDGRQLLAFDERVRPVELPSGRAVASAGLASVFAAMLRAIVPDGTRATALALAGVLLLLILLLRRASTVLLVLGSLLLGTLFMGGVGAALGLRLNFLSFVALPVTIGIGVDYSVNIAARLRDAAPRARAVALAETGAAVALCSATTVIGYGSLLLADNGALRSFGALAALGELGCIAAALIALPLWMTTISGADSPRS